MGEMGGIGATLATIGPAMLPNFLLIGCSKAGTTSLHTYLGQHPDIFMSRYKEPAYFVFAGTDGRFPEIADRRFVSDRNEYERLFAGTNGESAVGESSTYYLDYACAEILDRIDGTLPGARFLAVVRQPVDRAYSRYLMLIGGGRADLGTFVELFRSDLETYRQPRRLGEDRTWIAQSAADRLVEFRARYDRERVKVMRFDDFRADAVAFTQEIYGFLGVDPGFRPDTSVRLNTGGVYRSRLVGWVFNRPNPIRWAARRLLPTEFRIGGRQRIREKLVERVPALDPELRAELTALRLVREEIDRLEEMTGLDLAAWRT